MNAPLNPSALLHTPAKPDGISSEVERLAADSGLPDPSRTAHPGGAAATASVEVILAEDESGGEPDAPETVAGAVAVVSSDGQTTAAAVLTAGEVSAARAARAEATADRLIARLTDHVRPGMDPEVQEEVAALITLISDLAYEELTEFFPLVRVAVSAALTDPPNLVLASRIRRSVRLRTHLLLRPLLFLRTGHPAVQVILGLATNFYLAIPIALLLLSQTVRGSLFPGQNEAVFILVGVVGGVGSIVSMLVRIEDFDNQEAEHRAILFFTGFFKPIIGIASALFVVTILEAGLIPLAIENVDQRTFFFLALAFVAGFSERLASDIVAQAEAKVLNGSARATNAKG